MEDIYEDNISLRIDRNFLRMSSFSSFKISMIFYFFEEEENES